MSTLITCVGEALIDFLPIVEDQQTPGFRMHAGGSLLNVAVAAARLGQPVALATRLAGDFFGRFLYAYAQAEGIDPRWLVSCAAPCTLAFVADEHGEPAYSFYDAGAADSLLSPDDLPETLLATTAILHFGSISLLRGTTPAAVLDAAGRMQGRGLISLDPNLRPDLVHDEPAYRTTLARALALADLVKLSAVDLAWLAPGQPLEEAAAALLAQGPVLVVLTRGGEGPLALFKTASGVERVSLPAFVVEVADTIGAGDTFSGAMLAWLLEHGVTSRDKLVHLAPSALHDLLRFAAAAAAITCSRPAANPPRRAELAAFLA